MTKTVDTPYPIDKATFEILKGLYGVSLRRQTPRPPLPPKEQ
jgi:hypothetical protein